MKVFGVLLAVIGLALMAYGALMKTHTSTPSDLIGSRYIPAQSVHNIGLLSLSENLVQ